MAPNRGYARATKLLEEHFGNESKVTAAYVEKVLGWPSVKAEDVKGLQAYSLLLRECCNAIEEFEYISELDMPANMQAVVQKLPYKLRERWRTRASELLECYRCRACFMDIVVFIERQVRIASDPIFGDLQDSNYGKQSKVGNTNRTPSSTKIKENSFATTVVTADQSAAEDTAVNRNPKRQSVQSKTTKSSLCLCCSRHHWLEQCPLLEKKT